MSVLRSKIISVSKTVKSWLALGVLTLVWGSSYLLIKKGLVGFDPFQVTTLRVGIAAVAFFPFFLLKRKQVRLQDWKYLAVVGMVGTGIPAMLFPVAQTQISSSLAGVLSTVTPIFTLILGVLFFSTKVALRNIVGIVVGLTGAMALMIFGKSAFGSGNNWYGLLIVLGCFCYGLSVNTVKAGLQNLNPITLSSAAFALLLPFAIFGFWWTDVPGTLHTNSQAWSSLAYIAVLSLVGTFFASVLFFWLVQLTSAVFASTVAYLMPIVALALGALDGEIITVWHFGGMGLILIGVYLAKE